MLLGIVAAGVCNAQTQQAAGNFGPSNPFYAPSTLAFHAPAFDKIKDSDYQAAIDAGMAEQLKEVDAIANNSAAPTFENTLVAMERSGQLYDRAWEAFNLVTAANTDPELEKIQDYEAPRTAALADAINLNTKLFARIKAIYDQRASLGLDAESLRLVEYSYQQFVKAGANLSDADKDKLKKLDEVFDGGSQRGGGVERRPDSRGSGRSEGAQTTGLGSSVAEHHAATLSDLPE